jgi:hypothetical protein
MPPSCGPCGADAVSRSREAPCIGCCWYRRGAGMERPRITGFTCLFLVLHINMSILRSQNWSYEQCTLRLSQGGWAGAAPWKRCARSAALAQRDFRPGDPSMLGRHVGPRQLSATAACSQFVEGRRTSNVCMRSPPPASRSGDEDTNRDAVRRTRLTLGPTSSRAR